MTNPMTIASLIPRPATSMKTVYLKVFDFICTIYYQFTTQSICNNEARNL